jgi:hypothetical protein
MPGRPDTAAMKKRILAAVLWFYAGWYAGAMIAFAFGLSPVLGPIVGTAAAALIAGDPRHLIWTRRETAPSVAPKVSSEATAQA